MKNQSPKKKGNGVQKKTSNSNQPISNKAGNRKSVRFSIFIGIVIGIVLGLSCHFMISSKSSKQSINSFPLSGNVKNNGDYYPLLNPIASNDNYMNFSIQSLIPNKNEISRFIAKKHKNNPNIMISVYFKDMYMNNGFGIDDDALFSPSSLMKVPVMIALFKKAQENPSILSSVTTYMGSRENYEKGMDPSTKIGRTSLITGESYTMESLAYEMIVNSDNEATFLILDYIDVNFAEKVQKDLGFLINRDVSFFDDIISVKAYSCFFRTLYNASYLNREMSEKALELLSEARYGFGIRRSVPSEIMVAHKFGRSSIPIDSTHEQFRQLHHFGIVYYPGKPYLLGIMTRGTDESEMEGIIHEISKMVYESVDQQYNLKASKYIDRDLE